MPGQPDDVITIHLGYGRTRAGRVGSITVVDPDSKLPQGGFNAYEIRYADQPRAATGASASKTGEPYELAPSKVHFSMEGRELLREGSLDADLKDRDELPAEREPQQTELRDLS